MSSKCHDRRVFLKAGLVGSFLGGTGCQTSNRLPGSYSALDHVLKRPVFKRELFTDPVVIKSVELLRYKTNSIGSGHLWT